MSNSDISITITSDPTQAVNGIDKVKKAADDLSVSSKKVAESSAADNSQAINQVLSVSNQAKQAISQTGTAVGAVSTGIKQAATEASKVTGAFGQAVPVIGRIGSAISSAITGPIGAISAAIGLAIAGIQKMIADAEDRVNRLKLSAGARANAAQDNILAGQKQYQQDLQTLDQVKAINAIAEKSALTANELAQFRNLASQIGIEENYVGARGIRGDALQRAEHTLKQQRRFYSDQEYGDYVDAMTKQLSAAIEQSGLSDATKKRLAGQSALSLAETITSNARRGTGWTTEEFQAWQDLYAIVKPFNEIRAQHNLDAMGGRTQADLNAAAVAAITGAHDPSASGGAGTGSGGAASPKPGTLAWQKEQDRKAQAAAEAEAKEQDRRTAAAANLTDKLQQEIEIQTLINDGRQREADILRQRISLESALGRQLTTAEQASIEQLAGTLYDLRHPQEPSLAPMDPGAPASAARTRTRQQAYTMPLDRLQRIGANVAASAYSPERATLDRQLSVQEDIRNILRQTASQTYREYVMRF